MASRLSKVTLLLALLSTHFTAFGGGFDEIMAVHNSTKKAQHMKLRHETLAKLEKHIKSNPKAEDIETSLIKAAEFALLVNDSKKADSLKAQFLKSFPDSQGISDILKIQFNAGLGSKEQIAGASAALDELRKRGLHDQEGIQYLMRLAESFAGFDMKSEAKATYNKILAISFIKNSPQYTQMFNGMIKDLDIVGKPFQVFKTKDINGKAISLDQFKGKVVLIDFWATWCGPCIQMLPSLKKTYEKYHKKGFEVVSISLDEDLSPLASAIKSKGMTWHHIADGKGFSSPLARTHNITSIPATFLLDREGKVYRKGLRNEKLDQAVAKLVSMK